MPRVAAMVVCAGVHGYLAVPGAVDCGAVVVDSIDCPTRPEEARVAAHRTSWPPPGAFAPATPLDVGVDADGYNITAIGGHPFQRALIDLVREAHPGALWSVAPFDLWSLARATVDGHAVGLVCGLLRVDQ